MQQGAALLHVPGDGLGAGLLRQGGPEDIVHLLVMGAPLALALLLRAQVEGTAVVAMHAVVHQRMGAVQHPLDRRLAVSLLAIGDVALGEFEVVEDAPGIRPLLEQPVVLEEVVMPEGGMGDDQRLQGRGVLLHDIGEAGVGVDDDLIG